MRDPRAIAAIAGVAGVITLLVLHGSALVTLEAPTAKSPTHSGSNTAVKVPPPPSANIDDILASLSGKGITASDLELVNVSAAASRGAPFRMFVFRNGDPVSRLLREVGAWGPLETSAFASVLQPDCVTSTGRALVLDAGANLGFFTLLAASHGCRVISFEPSPRLCAIIAASAALNGLSDRIRIVNAGVGSVPGTLTYIFDPANPSLSRITGESLDRLPANGNLEYTAVPIVTLESERPPESVLLLKIDTEGFEDKVLAGLGESCGRHAIHHILFEVKEATAGETMRRLWQCMADSTSAAGLPPAASPRRGIWYSELYHPQEDLLRFLKEPAAFVQRRGFFEEGRTPHDFKCEDGWVSIHSLDLAAITPGAGGA